MEYETTIESENCFLVCDKNNRNNYTRVVKINVPTFLKKWSVEGKEFYRENFAMEYAKTLLKTREKDNTKELKAHLFIGAARPRFVKKTMLWH